MDENSPVGLALVCDDVGCWCIGYAFKSRICNCVKCHGPQQLLNVAAHLQPLWNGKARRDNR